MTPDPSTGQILPGSKFGDKLTELAREAKVIVEIGTWKGQGSTWCLNLGMGIAEDAWLITLESDLESYKEARAFLSPFHAVWSVWGTLVRPEEFPPYYDHPVENRKNQHARDRHLCEVTPYCLPIIPPEIDLLLLDGGEWSSEVEFQKLRDRSKIIALDDTHPGKSVKSWQARQWMISNGWTVLADEPDDRNGWFIGRKP